MNSLANFFKTYSLVLLVGAFYAQYMNHFSAFPIVPGYIAGSLGAIPGGAIGASAFGVLCGLALELIKGRGHFQGPTFLITSLLFVFVPWGMDLVAHFSHGNIE
jgi:hypothetical protein